MRELLRTYTAPILLGVIIVLSVFGASDALFTESLQTYVAEHRFGGTAVVAALMFVATVIAPVALVPLIPVIAQLLGPFLTAFASWVGWTLGSLVAFLIARYGGRPLLNRFISLDTLMRFEKRIPTDTHFALIVALRIAIPVDVLSYALGFLSTVRFKTYALASALGILPFSVALAYLGYALTERDSVLFIAYGVASALIFVGALWYVRTKTRSKH